MFSCSQESHRLQGQGGDAWCGTLAANRDTCCLSGVCVPQPHSPSRVSAALPLTTLWPTVVLQWRSRRGVCMAVMPGLHSQSSVLHNHHQLCEEQAVRGSGAAFPADLGVCGGTPNPAPPPSQCSFLQNSTVHAYDHSLTLPTQQARVCVCVQDSQRQSRALPRKVTVGKLPAIFVLWTFSVSFPVHQDILHFVGLQTSTG